METDKVPLLDGEFTSGHSQNGLEITINGELAQQENNLLLTELQMIDAMNQLRELIHTSHTDTPLTVFLIYDPIDSNYRYFENCSASKITFDLTSPHVYTYQLSLLIDTPTLQTNWSSA